MLLLNGLTPPDDIPIPVDKEIVYRDATIFFTIVGIMIAILALIVIRNIKSENKQEKDKNDTTEDQNSKSDK